MPGVQATRIIDTPYLSFNKACKRCKYLEEKALLRELSESVSDKSALDLEETVQRRPNGHNPRKSLLSTVMSPGVGKGGKQEVRAAGHASFTPWRVILTLRAPCARHCSNAC
eukprot:1159215-Pelagomonas_calceolata.AAC.18